MEVLRNRSSFEFFAVSFLIAVSFVMVATFFLAWEHEAVIVSINTHNEKWIEAVIFPAVLLLGIVTWIRMARRL